MTYELPKLDFDYNALEPHIDEATMRIHHTKHHQTYIDKVNAALSGTEYENTPIRELIEKLDSLPKKLQKAVRNAGGGHFNHTLFWQMLTPKSVECTGLIKEKIDETFGSFDEFKEQFTQAAIGQFGSGWAWLVLTQNDELEIVSTPNQDNPLSQGKKPLLGLDVWEHAYYLKYQNKRPEYVEHFFEVINWETVNDLLEAE